MMMKDDDDTKYHGKRRIKQSNSGFSLPKGVVLSANSATPPGFIEVGALFALLVLVIYFVGCYETISSLPDPPGMPDWSHHMGENLNIANLRWSKTTPMDIPSQQQQRIASAAGQNVKIPVGKWPVTLRDEKDHYESIVHPGDGKTVMSIPKFWSSPIHEGKLMARETAMKIGTCVIPDANGNHVRGEDCPVDERTIYVGIASYRDFECRTTAEDIFRRAKNPNRIRIGVVDQIVDGEDVRCDEPLKPCEEDPEQGLCKYKDQIDVYQMEAGLSVGPVFARHIGYRMYRGEYYATQSDAHVSYTQNWDADIIDQFHQTKNEMAVLSTYLTDVQGSIDPNGHSLRKTRPIMCNTIYEGGGEEVHLRHAAQPERMPAIHGTPQLQPWWAAGYSFSRGHFIVNVPYDLYLPQIFQGEEMSIGIRGYTIGYDYYAPERSVCFHHYAVGANAKIRNKVHHFWENTNNHPRGIIKNAMLRLLGIVHMNPEIDPQRWDHTEEDFYGIGGVRTPEKFYETFGIDVHKKTIEAHLCKFVHGSEKENAPMHKMFTAHLREDGMGIDYSGIDYRFVDPDK